MSLRYSILYLLRNVLVLVYGLSAPAQILGIQGQWVDDLFIFHSPLLMGPTFLLDDNDNVKKEIPFIANLTDFDLPVELRRLAIQPASYYNDGIYSVVFGGFEEESPNGTRFRRFSLVNYQNDEWQYIGSYKAEHKEDKKGWLLMAILQCDDDRFIAVSNEDLGGNLDSRKTPFARLALNREKKEFRFVSSIDHGQNDLRAFMSDNNNICFSYAFSSRFLLTKNYATLLNYKTGLYWIFSLEKATLVRAGNIFSMMEPEMLKEGGFDKAVLCANPEKDGSVLISAQSEKQFRAESEYKKEIDELMNKHNIGKPNATMTPQEFTKIFFEHNREVAYINPEIVWYRLYPENGKVEKLAMPPVGAAVDRDLGKNDYWRPMSDGSVKMAPEFKRTGKIELELKNDEHKKANVPNK